MDVNVVERPVRSRRAKLLVPLVALAVVGGVWVWWMQGGVGGPVSDEAARSYFERIVAAAEAKDFETLCRLNSSVGTCGFELNYVCRAPGVAGPLRLPPEQLLEECRQSVPTEPPEIVGSRHHPGEHGYVGGRMLLVRGADGRGTPYETEVLIFRDKRSYKATHAVFWSNDKFDEIRNEDGSVDVKAEPEE
ncbi:MAG: hypothetical protein ACRDZ3_04980 [Acidimicrobiia bacterium]